MLRSFSKLNNLNNNKFSFFGKFFTTKTQTNYTIDVFPDQIVSNLKSNINKFSEENLKEIETDIVNKINFFDSDQYADVVTILARADKGTDLLWDVLSRKVFDYEFDLIQTESLLTALNHTNKYDSALLDPLRKNMIRFHTGKDDKYSKLYRSLYH